MKLKISALVLALTVVAGAAWVWAEIHRPSPVPKSWEFEARVEKLRAIRVKLTPRSEPQTFWYVIYTVINRTGDDRSFTPEFWMYTEAGSLMRAGRRLPEQQVYKAIKTLHNDPLLRMSSAVSGKLLQGEDNAKHGVAIWPDFDAESGQVDIFIGGLSGETVEMKLPKPIKKEGIDKDGNKVVITKTKVRLSKTLQLTYKIPGDKDNRYRSKPELTDTKWVMR
jgi:hypothetical protein